MRGIAVVMAGLLGICTWLVGVGTFIAFWAMVGGGVGHLLGFDVPVAFQDLVVYWVSGLIICLGFAAMSALAASAAIGE